MVWPTAASSGYTVLLDSLKGAVEKKGASVSGLLTMSERDRIPIYKEIARTLGLRGAERQQDVYGFLAAVLKKLGRSQ